MSGVKKSFLTVAIPVCSVAVVLALVIVQHAEAIAAAQGDCDSSEVEIIGGDPFSFVLPRDDGQRITVDPDAVLDVGVRNPPRNGTLRVRVAGFPAEPFQRTYRFQSDGSDVNVESFSIADYARWARGIYSLEGELLDSTGQTICEVALQVRIGGFGGLAGVASAVAAGIGGATVVFNVSSSVANTRARIKVDLALERRRRRGLRRWLPFPSLKSTITGSILGTISGVVVVVLLQQSGITPISLGKAIIGLVVGGVAPISVTVALGTIINFLRPLEEEPAAPQDEQ